MLRCFSNSSDLFDRAWSQEPRGVVAIVGELDERRHAAISLGDPFMAEAANTFQTLAPTDWFDMPFSASRSFVQREGKNDLYPFLTLTASRIE